MKQKGYWTYEKCKEAALECSTKEELRKKYGTAHKLINKNKWLELIEHFENDIKPNGYWTYEKCKDAALKCESRKELAEKYGAVRALIYKNKWMELFSHFIDSIKPNGYWTYEKCKDAALICESKVDLKNRYNTAYNKINENKWIELTSHFIEGIKPKGYWTYEKCKDAALKCENKSDFIKKYSSANNTIYINKWTELTSHFIEIQKPNGYWTYEKCKEIALLCNNASEFSKKYRTAYKIVTQNKWKELTSHFIEIQNPNGYWTYEKCKEVSLECETKKELKNKYVTAYGKIYKEKWLDLLLHLKKVGNKYNRLIYAYEFSDNHCYVGLTGNIKRRNNQHLLGKNKSSVKKHIIETNLIPILNIKSDYINVNDAILLEGEVLNNYKKDGWIMLNEVKTGGIGAHDLKWTRETCKDEVEKYKNLSDFVKYSGGAYVTIHNNGWIDLLDPIRTRKILGYWNNKELCENEAKKYKNLTEFSKKCYSAFKYSKNNGWLYDFYNVKQQAPNGYWNDKEKCRIESKKYKNRKDFCKKCHTAYTYSYMNGWIDEFFSITSKNGYWNNKELCKEEAKKYKTRTKFKKKYWAAYNYSYINGWLDEFFPKK